MLLRCPWDPPGPTVVGYGPQMSPLFLCRGRVRPCHQFNPRRHILRPVLSLLQSPEEVVEHIEHGTRRVVALLDGNNLVEEKGSSAEFVGKFATEARCFTEFRGLFEHDGPVAIRYPESTDVPDALVGRGFS